MTQQFSIEDLSLNAKKAVDAARIGGEPVAITQGERAVAVLVDADAYSTQMQALREFERIYRDEAAIKPARKPEEIAAEAKAQQVKPTHAWRCTICGYTVETDDDLPDGFTCPMCGVGKDMFERIDL